MSGRHLGNFPQAFTHLALINARAPHPRRRGRPRGAVRPGTPHHLIAEAPDRANGEAAWPAASALRCHPASPAPCMTAGEPCRRGGRTCRWCVARRRGFFSQIRCSIGMAGHVGRAQTPTTSHFVCHHNFGIERRVSGRRFSESETKGWRVNRRPFVSCPLVRAELARTSRLNSEIFHHLPASVRLLLEDGQVGARGILRLFGLRVRISDCERAAAVGEVTRAGDLGLLV